MDWSQTTFWPALRILFLGLIRTPPEKRDAKALEESRQKTIDALGALDAKLATSAYLAGAAFTMGDIPLGAGVWRWMALPIERPAFPNVQRWFELLSQRAPYRQVVMQPLS
jgi:glutathione S-transferase